MDFRTAQRNLELVNQNAEKDDLDDLEANVNTSIEMDEEIIGTQVPLAMFSDDDIDPMDSANSSQHSQVFSQKLASNNEIRFDEVQLQTTDLALDNKNTAMTTKIIDQVKDNLNLELSKGNDSDQNSIIIIPDGLHKAGSDPTDDNMDNLMNNNMNNNMDNNMDKNIDSNMDNNMDSNMDDNMNDDTGDNIGDNRDEIFMNTQIQGRLDDFEKEKLLKSSLKSTLNHFKYPRFDSPSIGNSKENIGELKKSPAKSRQSKLKLQKSNNDKKVSRAERVLKLLSGKHSKVRDIISIQRNIEAKKTKASKTSQNSMKFDIYNEQEWKQITQLIFEAFPKVKEFEMKEVYHYIYGEEQEVASGNMWEASQTPLLSLHEERKGDEYNYDKYIHRLPIYSQPSNVDVVSLSQVMNDKSFSEFKFQSQSDEYVEVQDSTDDEVFEIIPMRSPSKSVINEVETENEMLKFPPILRPPSQKGDQPILDATTLIPNTNFFNGVIDLTQESFKAVNSLISPVKTDYIEATEITQVQVPASRNITLQRENQSNLDLNETHYNTVNLTQDNSITYQFYGDRKKVLDNNFNIELIEKYQIEVGDSEDENNDDLIEPSIIEIKVRPNTPTSSPNKSVKEIITSQSMKKLRENMKTIGLKPLKSKEKMIEALTVASQVFDADDIGLHTQREEVYRHLTLLVKQIPSLLEKIYTFEPVFIEDLVSQLADSSPFVEHIDEVTIREWADKQGICLRKN
ncbi:hypothetical protein TPHA_0C00770 [Tetrapisispora phaffii CBS 4417]|uniref:Structure-specific endonuclease subunit SLX4 n=1 Tax=Tetrapisispora phaffii (strain ATCC 24235 / CBS 4417 / NBRC 1672 / NRRL Y-8282 / UCD 70-5) TaxID=1071381 RepID=G8BR57_TETPH|nr:hypothetical protein TPHA_0C00770 [Tetrapisispora phaffii CBS 4417]CCE62233.1 hypothetical protein TPHA_0C00770 [Tetrapisispora phaffii CBS 4417]